MSDDSAHPRAVVVDDEKEVADAYTLRLMDDYDVQTAYSGEAALGVIDDQTHVVLLDRNMPGVSGDEVLREIKARELSCRVIMVTAIDPSFGILDMPFDDYLCKPLDRETVLAAVRQQVELLAYERLSEYFQVDAKRALLASEKSTAALEAAEEYEQIEARAEALRAELDRLLDDFDAVASQFEAIERER